MDYLPKFAPRAHQHEALARVKRKPPRPADTDVFAWLMEMGTGKSKVIIDEFGERELTGDLHDLLIIAPAGSYGNWYRLDDQDPGELQKHASHDLLNRIAIEHWSSGASPRRIAELETFMDINDRPRAFIVNVEALSTVKKARALCEQFAAARHCMLAVDESTVIKSPRAQRTKFILKLGKVAKARRIATGLVTPRDPLDLYTQFEFLDWRILGFKSYWAFRRRYAITQAKMYGGRRVEVVVGFRNVEELQHKIAPYSYRVLKEECLDIPKKIYMARDVALTDEQRRMYKELKLHATTAINAQTYVTATAVITQILRLDQLLCGHVIDEAGELHHVPENRINEIVELLEEHAGKAIIWTAYDPCVYKLASRLREHFGEKSVACFWGGNRSSRAEDELRFKTDPECRFMISTPGAGGRGNTWTVATLVIYHSNTNNLEHRSQSEDRAHRDGQTQSVTYVDCVARGTVDEKKLKALRAKIDMATVISGDNYREWLI